ALLRLRAGAAAHLGAARGGGDGAARAAADPAAGAAGHQEDGGGAVADPAAAAPGGAGARHRELPVVAGDSWSQTRPLSLAHPRAVARAVARRARWAGVAPQQPPAMSAPA